jgi:predicted nucleic acid-binding protein
VLLASRAEPLITNFIVAECHALMLRRLGAHVARQWLFGNTWRIEPVHIADELKARDILRAYTDKSFSYTDATSFAVMERLRIRRAFAFDKHFEQYGFELV